MAGKAWSSRALGVTRAAGASGEHGVLEKVRETPELSSAKSFLLSHASGGVYTCARATRTHSKQYELVLWEFHLGRLATGVRSVADKRFAGADEQWIDELQRITKALCMDVLRHVELDCDVMLTALWWTEPSGAHETRYNVSVHACMMPTPSSTTSTVLIHGQTRANPLCKHTRWITDRVPLEAHTSQISATHGPIHETILSSSDGDDVELLEGLITNFFIVQDGKVVTAADGVLHGSTRELVLKACEELQIPVIFRAPRFSERRLWQAAFVTSAVRLAINVTCVIWSDKETGQIQEFRLAPANADITVIIYADKGQGASLEIVLKCCTMALRLDETHEPAILFLAHTHQHTGDMRGRGLPLPAASREQAEQLHDAQPGYCHAPARGHARGRSGVLGARRALGGARGPLARPRFYKDMHFCSNNLMREASEAFNLVLRYSEWGKRSLLHMTKIPDYENLWEVALADGRSGSDSSQPRGADKEHTRRQHAAESAPQRHVKGLEAYTVLAVKTKTMLRKAVHLLLEVLESGCRGSRVVPRGLGL